MASTKAAQLLALGVFLNVSVAASYERVSAVVTNFALRTGEDMRTP
jgi:hypothetical protein